ncbi:MAG TPA: hypothetical protein VG452_00360 [Egibacteraceae bacterium]|nr:hypothetical protein [Actinomycetota bacterium]HWB70641.1 hypothetical protein [Egibacteraceae bacterium]
MGTILAHAGEESLYVLAPLLLILLLRWLGQRRRPRGPGQDRPEERPDGS